MEESGAKDVAEDEAVPRNAGGQYFGKENFKMYYALGPELEHGNSMDYEAVGETDDFKNRKFKYFTSDFEEDSDDNVINECEEYKGTELSDGVDVKDEELSDDSGTVDEKDWKGASVPPDIVASANHFKVIREEPKSNKDRLSGDIKNSDELFKEPCDQDITDFRRHQVEAYTNLEDLLDEPWEESDFAPPSKVDVVLRVGGEIGERYNNVMGAQGRRKMRVIQKAGLDPTQYQCGPLCNNCSIM
jgi:hypothetical protein